jgi:hypothetical protein
VLYQLSYSRLFPSAKVSIYFGITGILDKKLCIGA